MKIVILQKQSYCKTECATAELLSGARTVATSQAGLAGGSKGPRITPNARHWRDSGVLHALLRFPPEDDLLAQPWVGASWEGFVIEQVLAARAAHGQACEAYFFRSHDGYEADLVIEEGRLREAIEIKLTSGPAPEDLARLGQVSEMIGADRSVLLCHVGVSVTTGRRWVTNLPDDLRATV